MSEQTDARGGGVVPAEAPVSDVPPRGPSLEDRLSIDDFEAAASELLPRMVYDYYAGGAGSETTLAENRLAFDRWALRPRVLVDVSEIDTSVSVVGTEIAFPIGVAPTAFHRLAHPDGELATARAARSLGTIMVLSTISTVALEEIAATGVSRWFQLYVMRDRGLTRALLGRAAAAGFGAAVLTVDTPVLGRRIRDERNRFTLPPGIGMANLDGMELPKPDAPASGLAAFFGSDHDASLSWRDLAWVREACPLPLVLKGIVTREDAARALDAGVDGIIVSNHGGRQLDGSLATLDALPEVVEAVDGRIDVLLDGGVRRGTDVLKALALGARAVLIGRPALWGLATGGEDGVRAVLDLLRRELVLAMGLCGRPRVSDVDRSLVAPAPGRVGGV